MLPGLFALLWAQPGKEWQKVLRVAVMVVLTNLLASALVGSWAQGVISGTPFWPMAVSRLPAIAVRTLPEAVLVYMLSKLERVIFEQDVKKS